MKRTIYLVLVQSILYYSFVFWGQAYYESHIYSLNTTLNIAIKFIFNISRLKITLFMLIIIYIYNIRFKNNINLNFKCTSLPQTFRHEELYLLCRLLRINMYYIILIM